MLSQLIIWHNIILKIIKKLKIQILHIIREEYNKSLNKVTKKDATKTDEDKKKMRLRRITSLNLLVDYSNIKLTLAPKATQISNITEDDEDYESDNATSSNVTVKNSFNGYTDEYNEYKDNILTNIDELINELESISEVIKDQAIDHINDNDVILTANHSDQLEDFFVEASQEKSFHVIIAESAPSLKYKIIIIF